MSWEQSKNEYALLRNYNDNGIIVRGFTFRILDETLQQIEADTWVVKYDAEMKPMIRSIIQINAISVLAMYIEDLSVIAESFREGKNYYDFLNKETSEEDLGDVIGNFFKNVGSFSDDDISKIMSYVNISELQIEEKQKELVKRHINANIEEVRRLLKQFGDFGETNHPVFKRFKHAGVPIFIGIQQHKDGSMFSIFDSLMMVSKGINPLEDVIPIPYSPDVWKAYVIMELSIRTMLERIVTHRYTCLNRKITGIIPTSSYSSHLFTFAEAETIGKLAEDFLTAHPEDTSYKKIDLKPKISKTDIQWYLELPSFLATCKALKEKKDRFDKEFSEYKNKQKS